MKKNNFFLFPNPQKKNIFICLITAGNSDFIFQFSQNPPFFQCESKLAQLLSGKESYIEAELQKSSNVDLFCKKIAYMASKLFVNEIKLREFPSSSYFQRILDEIKEIGWEQISNIDPTLSFFEVEISDEKNRKIEIRFDLDNEFPNVPPKISSNLPVPIKFDWIPQKSRLNDILTNVKEMIPDFNLFWSQLEELDNDAFVIEPHEPTLNCCIRRIVLTNQVQMKIELSVKRPMNPPKVSFLGAEMQSNELREKYEVGVINWNTNRSLKENLEEILEMELAKKDSKEINETDFDCAICYMDRLGGELPEIVCEKCLKRFHRSCLYDWLRTRRDSEQSYQVIFGNCPFCSHEIQCNISNIVI